ncbi:MAG: argininosuccinate lyase [Deltaproteobacteria bacterium]
MTDPAPTKPWGGRFREETAHIVERFTSSVHFDRRLAPYDIAGSLAHARMLFKQGIITRDERDAIVSGLEGIRDEISAGSFVWREDLEDVHMNIEHALVERIGEAGKKLHTARSRNDQVATDARLYVRDEIDRINGLLGRLQKALVHQARSHADLVIPGYTHLQRAQPVLWAHHMLAYFEMFRRDRERLVDCRKRVNICPLGSSALAGTGFPLDREFVARELGFDGISANSMDAVGDRDFMIEFAGALAIVMIHLSRLSEELVLWSTSEFSFVELPDAFCTGSSIMPQKKNPDVPELVRGKTGRVLGHLMALLTLVKGLPLAYNRDLQEDKEAIFDAIDTAASSVEVMAALVEKMRPVEDRIREALRCGFLTATDLADYLVRKEVPFRTAHSIVGKAVAWCMDNGRELDELSLEELRRFSPLIGEDVFSYIAVEGSVRSRKVPGGTAPEAVRTALEAAERWLEGMKP